MRLPGGSAETTKALSSTALRGNVTSTLSPADTTSSLTAEGTKQIDNKTTRDRETFLREQRGVK